MRRLRTIAIIGLRRQGESSVAVGRVARGGPISHESSKTAGSVSLSLSKMGRERESR